MGKALQQHEFQSGRPEFRVDLLECSPQIVISLLVLKRSDAEFVQHPIRGGRTIQKQGQLVSVGEGKHRAPVGVRQFVRRRESKRPSNKGRDLFFRHHAAVPSRRCPKALSAVSPDSYSSDQHPLVRTDWKSEVGGRSRRHHAYLLKYSSAECAECGRILVRPGRRRKKTQAATGPHCKLVLRAAVEISIAVFPFGTLRGVMQASSRNSDVASDPRCNL